MPPPRMPNPTLGREIPWNSNQKPRANVAYPSNRPNRPLSSNVNMEKPAWWGLASKVPWNMSPLAKRGD